MNDEKTLKKLRTALNYTTRFPRPLLTHVLCQDDTLTVTDLETSIKIKSNFGLEEGFHKAKTLGLENISHVSDVRDFPKLQFENSHSESIDMNDELMKSFVPYMSKDETRIMLNGLAVNSGYLVATDGHRLKKHKINELEDDYIIPRKSINLMLKLLKIYKIKDFQLSLGDVYTILDTEFFTLSARNINREYPKWQAVVPTKTEHKFTIDSWPNFKELIKPILQKSKVATIKLADEKVSLVVNGNSFDIGHCEQFITENIGVNAVYLNDVMNKQSQVDFEFNNNLSPILFSGENNDGVIMPMKI